MNQNSFFTNEKKIRYALVCISGIALILLLLILTFYNNPSADDFNYSVNVRQYGFFKAQYYWYIHWCGRYFSTFLLSMNPLVFGSFVGYKLVSFFLIIVSFTSFYIFADRLFKNSSRFEKFYIAVLCFSSFILLMPSISEAYYWMAAAVSYQSGNILTLFLFILIVSNYEKPSLLKKVISIILVGAIAGTNEYSMMIIVLILLFINILVLIRKRKLEKFYLLLLIIALIGSLIVYFAPGNTYRASFQPDKHHFIFSVKSSLIQAFDVISHWWWIGILIMGVTFIISNNSITEKKDIELRKLVVNPFLVIVAIFIVIPAGFFSCYWSLGLYPPLRTINSIFFYFIIGTFYTGICLAFFLDKYNVKIPFLKYIQILIPLLLLVYLLKIPNNIGVAFHDLEKGTAKKYNQELTDRYNKLFTDDCRICPIKKLENIPKTIYFTEINDKTDIAMYRSYASFFNKDSIFIATE